MVPASAKCWLVEFCASVIAASLALGGTFAQGRATTAAERPIAVANVTLLPMTGTPVMPGRTVLIREGVIAGITPASANPPPAAQVIDGTGLYLMPGLADMHVHLQPADSEGINRKMLDLFLANGVTTVRNMLGSPYLLELRDSVARRQVRGPAIFTSGPVIDGPASQWTDRAAIARTAADAERIVGDQRRAGYDFLKIYSRLGKEAYMAVLAAARAHGMRVTGHVPVAVTLEDALAEGQSSIEHLLGYLDAIESDLSPVRGKQGWQYRMQAFDFVDAGKIPRVAAASRESGIWNCPTLVAMRKWVPADEARRLLERNEMKYAPGEVLEHWLPWRGFRLENFGAADFKLADRARGSYLALVAALHDAGAKVLVGTDTPSPFVVPGFSLHEELRNLVDAGFTPYEALEAATRGAAEHLGRAGEFGVIATGARADLLLLEANPLDDIANAKQLAGVFVQGRWIPKSEIDSMLRRLAAASR